MPNRSWVASRASGASPELPEIISVISSPISHLRLSARSDLRYLFVLATVHYDVLSDGQSTVCWMSARRLLGLVGGFDSLELERERGLVRRVRLAMLFGVTSKGGK